MILNLYDNTVELHQWLDKRSQNTKVIRNGIIETLISLQLTGIFRSNFKTMGLPPGVIWRPPASSSPPSSCWSAAWGESPTSARTTAFRDAQASVKIRTRRNVDRSAMVLVSWAWNQNSEWTDWYWRRVAILSSAKSDGRSAGADDVASGRPWWRPLEHITVRYEGSLFLTRNMREIIFKKGYEVGFHIFM